MLQRLIALLTGKMTLNEQIVYAHFWCYGPSDDKHKHAIGCLGSLRCVGAVDGMAAIIMAQHGAKRV